MGLMKSIRTVLVVAMVAYLGSAAGAKAEEKAGGAAPLLWIEGESAPRRQVHHNAWFDSVSPADLSGGAQIGNFSEPKDPEGWAEYDVDIPEAGACLQWTRPSRSKAI